MNGQSCQDLFFDSPDITEDNGITMSLQVDDICVGTFGMLTGSSVSKFQIVVNNDTIVFDCYASIFNFLASIVKSGGREINIVGLPNQWWQSHIGTIEQKTAKTTTGNILGRML